MSSPPSRFRIPKPARRLILAGVIAAGFTLYLRSLPDRSAQGQTIRQIHLLREGLAGYHSDHGAYPVNEDITKGGHVLYKALFGDHDGDREPDEIGPDGSRIYCYVIHLAPPPLDSNGQPMGSNLMVRELHPGEFHVVDLWGNPIYYICRPKSDAYPSGGGVHNPTYDLWSQGTDDLSGTQQQRQAKWIKNW